MSITTKFSRQREALKTELKSRTDHPTADQLYKSLREVFPNISLGTVYRNLSMLEKNNDILRITNDSGCEHYDGNTTPHCHFTCVDCGSVIDVFTDIDIDLNKKAEQAIGAKVYSSSIIFYGKCNNCK